VCVHAQESVSQEALYRRRVISFVYTRGGKGFDGGSGGDGQSERDAAARVLRNKYKFDRRGFARNFPKIQNCKEKRIDDA